MKLTWNFLLSEWKCWIFQWSAKKNKEETLLHQCNTIVCSWFLFKWLKKVYGSAKICRITYNFPCEHLLLKSTNIWQFSLHVIGKKIFLLLNLEGTCINLGLRWQKNLQKFDYIIVCLFPVVLFEGIPRY